MGIISQRYRPRSGAPAAAFQKWIDQIKEAVATNLVPALMSESMSVTEAEFKKADADDTPFNLCNIADFNSLIAKSQGLRTPVYALTDAQINEVGVVLEQAKKNREAFKETFNNLAKTIITLAKL
jgi:hypothetical protein